VLLYTDEEKERMPKIFFNDKVYALNNGIENKLIKEYVKPYNADERERSILFIGRLTSKSHVDLLIKVIHGSSKCLYLHIIGDGPLYKEYLELARGLGVFEKIYFHGKIICENKISKIANRCKIFVYPGNVGLSLIHAFNYGLPAIVHSDKDRHMPEVACHKPGLTGEVFERESYKDLKKNIDALIDNNEKLNFYSNICLASVKNDYNTDVMLTRFSSMISSID
jgi:glycosyltransferase involved in cell wall biosynthesis